MCKLLILLDINFRQQKTHKGWIGLVLLLAGMIMIKLA